MVKGIVRVDHWLHAVKKKTWRFDKIYCYHQYLYTGSRVVSNKPAHIVNVVLYKYMCVNDYCTCNIVLMLTCKIKL